MVEERRDWLVKIKTCAIMQYLQYYDTSDISVIESRIKSLTNIKTYCIAIHDKDIKDDGTPKPPHFHAVLTFKDTTTIGTVARWLNLINERWELSSQFVERIRKSTKSAQYYLVHRNNPEKYQYDTKDIVANFDYIEFLDWIKPFQKREDIVDRIAKWEIKEYNLQEYVEPSVYVKHLADFKKAFIYRQKKMENIDRELTCVFISGPSGVWKTTFAKMSAEALKYKCYVSDGWKHPLDNYEGQECIIMDDLRDDDYKFSEFLKLTDNNTSSLVGCRFYNKSIWECKLLVVTSTQPITDFYKFDTGGRESQEQLFRRFHTWVEMDENKVVTYIYDINKHCYVESEDQKPIRNPVTILYDKEKARNFMKMVSNYMSFEEYKPKTTPINEIVKD